VLLTVTSCLPRVGDSAYVTTKEIEEDEDVECPLEACEVCQKTRKMRGRKEVPLLECDQCLRGYHLDCVDPPLGDVPKVWPPTSFLPASDWGRSIDCSRTLLPLHMGHLFRFHAQLFGNETHGGSQSVPQRVPSGMLGPLAGRYAHGVASFIVVPFYSPCLF